MSAIRNEVIKFTINGKLYEVGTGTPPDTSLNTFIRENAHLPGTKFMCREGVCGACIVTLQTEDPVTREDNYSAVNSCLYPVWACNGASITTIEGLGSRSTGYHQLQIFLAKLNGTQCGYCSPGMIMNMYSLLLTNSKITMKEIEDSFGGNICRCTGYRPIMDAFKMFASDSSSKSTVKDIEDLFQKCSIKIEKNQSKECNWLSKRILKFPDKCLPREQQKSKVSWFEPSSLSEIWKIFKHIGETPYALISGNTAQGILKSNVDPGTYIDLNKVADLKAIQISKEQIEIGANIPLTKVMNLFEKISISHPLEYLHLKELAKHLNLVANVPVRNTGTIAGNLCIKHQDNNFSSDIFVMLEAARARLVLSKPSSKAEISLIGFLQSNLKKVVITKIILPLLSSNEYILRTYKIMPRAQNASAYINAGFLFKLDKYRRVLETPSIIFGGINSNFVHAIKTENYFEGKHLLDNDVLKEGFQILHEELNPNVDLLKPSVEYRKMVAVCLLYKFILGLGDPTDPRVKSGMVNLERKLGTGEQHWGEKAVEVIPKVEAIPQTSGEAEYVNDLPPYPGQLYGALVIAKQAIAVIKTIDASKALAIPGVVAFFSAQDIPGENNFIMKHLFMPDKEELLCSGKILYAGQPVGMIVAESYETSVLAAEKVEIIYTAKETPMLSVKQVLQNNLTSRVKLFTSTNGNKDFDYKGKLAVSGEVELGSQFHFTMEPQSCVCVPIEDGIDVFAATQWMQNIQATISKMLNIPENSINLKVRRIGGGFGCKITRSSMVANACALAAYKLNKPVRMVLNIQTNMETIGKRSPAYSKYDVAFDGNGKIQEMQVKFYEDLGNCGNDPGCSLVETGIQNCYDYANWKVEIYEVVTDTPSTAWMRAPGTLEGVLLIEQIMEHVATALGKKPLEIRLQNIGNYPLIKKMIEMIKINSNYDKREQETLAFNKENRWKKRGISLMPMMFHIEYFFSFHAMISIYAEDGTVSVTTGGVEMGQGLNTKVSQVCASAFGIDMDMVKVKPTTNLTAPNDGLSGASITSDTCCYSVSKCCEMMLERLEPVRKALGQPTWQELIAQAYLEDVDLNVSYMNSTVNKELHEYCVNGVAVTEVEIDLLTGQYIILRADIIEDAGDTLNPSIDVGQVEGAFVMGLGYLLTERIIYDPESGINVANRSWHYWPPGVKDIPADFRVKLLKLDQKPEKVGRAKTTGEPPLCLAYSAVCAIRHAVKAAREESGCEKEWFNLEQPCSVEKVFLSSKITMDQLHL